MSVTRGRIVRSEAVGRAKPILRRGPSDEQRARLTREEMEAHQNADRVLHMALTRSEAILAAARAESERVAADAARNAAEMEQTRLAAAWIALREREEKRAARELDRTVALARVLAERLLGHAIELDPKLIVSIARQALTEARTARRIRLEASPLDAPALRTYLSSGGLGGPDGVVAEVIENADLARGSLRVHTELGTLDASLHPRLERLAAALRDALEPA